MTARAPERLKVLRIIARMNVGGPAVQVAALATRLNPERFESRLLVGSVDQGEADHLDLRAPDVPARRVRGLGRAPRPSDDARALAALIREVRTFRPHIVHTHTAKAGLLGRIAAIVGATPIVVHTFHGHLLRGYFSPRVTAGLMMMERQLARRTDRLVSVGECVRDDLIQAGVGRPSQYTVVAPGVDLPPGPPRRDARATLGLPSDAPVVAFVARLTGVKRPDRFLDVALRVRERFPDTVFVVAGEGALLTELKRRAQPMDDGVRFVGWRPDIETVYAAADVVLLTSDNEGMPVSLIEAAHAGRPAVTTDVGSAAEVVSDGDTGLVVPPDPAALAAATERLLINQDLRLRLGSEAQARAARMFSTERLVKDTEDLYAAVAEQKGLTRHSFASVPDRARPDH